MRKRCLPHSWKRGPSPVTWPRMQRHGPSSRHSGLTNIYIYIYVCMYVCMYVYIYIAMEKLMDHLKMQVWLNLTYFHCNVVFLADGSSHDNMRNVQGWFSFVAKGKTRCFKFLDFLPRPDFLEATWVIFGSRHCGWVPFAITKNQPENEWTWCLMPGVLLGCILEHRFSGGLWIPFIFTCCFGLLVWNPGIRVSLRDSCSWALK